MLLELTDRIAPGCCLIATPFLKVKDDPMFARSVVLITDHDPLDGTMGLILNRPASQSFQEIFPDAHTFTNIEAPVFVGGPVEQVVGYSLITVNDEFDAVETLPSSFLQVSPGVYRSHPDEVFKSQEEGLISDDQVRYFCGASGWEKNQLESELEHGAWILISGLAHRCMQWEVKDVWRNSLRCLPDPVFQLWSMLPNNPEHN